MIIYVNANAPKEGNGSRETPFRHINDAAKVAMPGHRRHGSHIGARYRWVR